MRKENSILNIIARALVDYPGSTGAELSKKIHIDSAYRRLSEVRKLGLAKTGIIRKCEVTGRNCVTWFPDDSPVRIDISTGLRPHEEIKRLKERIAFLEKRVAHLTEALNDKNHS